MQQLSKVMSDTSKTSPPQTIGSKLKSLRETSHMSFAQVSETTSIDPYIIEGIEKDAKSPTLSELSRIAAAYGYAIRCDINPK